MNSVQQLSPTSTIETSSEIAIELLKKITPVEKKKVLKKIAETEPLIALEMLQKSLNLFDLNLLAEEELAHLITYLNPAIMGLVLKLCETDFQLKILHLATADYAKEAYELLQMPINSEDEYLKKSEKKILKLALALHREKYLQLF